MKTKIYTFALFVIIFFLISAASAQPSVGVKAGDWIEYQVTYTGNVSPDHAVKAAKMEVTHVSGPVIQVNITSTYANDTKETTTSTLNLQTGDLIDDFIIPANLKTGDQFLDSRVGNITITSTMQRVYAGATRTVVSATSLDNIYVWDQATGISVEGISEGADYSMHSLATATNIWSAPTLDPVIVYTLIVLVVIIIAAVVVLLVMRRKGKIKS
jgi:hypothetical protein